MMKQFLLPFVLYYRVIADRGFPFFGKEEHAVRHGPFEERTRRVPRTLKQTPAFEYLNSLQPANITVVIDNIVPRVNARKNLLEALQRTGNWTDDRITRDIQLWTRYWDSSMADLTRACEKHNLQTWRTGNVSTYLSLAVPSAPNRLLRSIMFMKSLRYLEMTPHSITMAISKVRTRNDYIQLAGFLNVFEGSSILQDTLPHGVHFQVVYHNSTQFQWANRVLAARQVHSEYVAFSDNDDFLSPWRFRVTQLILERRPELDLILMAYNYAARHFNFSQKVDFIGSIWEIGRPSDETILGWTTYDTEGYHELLKNMHLPSVLKWQLGSLAHEPFMAEVTALAHRMIDVDRRALSSDPNNIEIKKELGWLESVLAKRDVPGRYWKNWDSANGWPTIRSKVLDIIPCPTEMSYGEDSLCNWRIIAAGLNAKAFHDMTAGTYVFWDNIGLPTFAT